MTVTRTRILIAVTAEITARLFTSGYAAFLAEDGYDVHLVADGVDGLVPQLADRGVTVHSLAMSRDPNPLKDGPSLIAMVRLVRSLRPDVVVYATPKASLLAALASWFARVPVRIYALWGIRFETATGVGRFVLRSFERIIARLSTAVVANSASLADRAAVLGIATRDRISVPAHGSSHGVDVVRFDRDAERPAIDEKTAVFLRDGGDFTVGYVGRLHPDKGIDTLAEAVEILSARDQAVRVVLVGGDEGAFTVPVGGAQKWHRTGEVADVRPYLVEFDVLVLMSLREGFPNVVLEAAAMKVPSVVSDATGCVDAVLDGQTGRIVPVGDAYSLARCIEDLKSREDVRLAMGAAARERAVSDFEQTDVWRAHERHIADQLALGETRRSRRAPGRPVGATRNEES